MVNATDYGHGDMMDPEVWWILGISQFCAANSEGRRQFEKHVGGEIVSFMKGIVRNIRYLSIILSMAAQHKSKSIQLSK